MSAWTIVPLAVWALLVGAGYLVWWVDRYRWEPLGSYALAVLLGLGAGVAALALVSPALLGGSLSGFPTSSAAAPGAGAWLWNPALALEVTARQLLTLAVLALLTRSSFVHGPLDGSVCGLGAGVAAALPGLVTGVLRGDASVPWSGTYLVLLAACTGVVLGAFVGRGVLAGRGLGVLGWGSLGALASGALGYAATGAWRASGGGSERFAWSGLLLPVLALAVVVGLLTGVVVLEGKVLRRQLEEEVRFGVLPSWVGETVASYRRRTRSEWWPRGDERRALTGVIVSLAFKKEQLERLAPDARNLYGLEVGRLRQRVRLALSDVEQSPVAQP
jgi:hypothetical protein